MASRSVIYEDLINSEFVYETENFRFKFSSLFYLDKYQSEVSDFREKLRKKFTSLYLVPVELSDYADIVYYNKIEKRGFCVTHKETGVVLSWVGALTLSGVIKTSGN